MLTGPREAARDRDASMAHLTDERRARGLARDGLAIHDVTAQRAYAGSGMTPLYGTPGKALVMISVFTSTNLGCDFLPNALSVFCSQQSRSRWR